MIKLSSIKLENGLVHVTGQKTGCINRMGVYSRPSTSSRGYRHYICYYICDNTPYYSNLNPHIDVNQLHKSFYYLMSNES